VPAGVGMDLECAPVLVHRFAQDPTPQLNGTARGPGQIADGDIEMELLGPTVGPLGSHVGIGPLKGQFRHSPPQPHFRPVGILVDRTSEQLAVEPGERRRIRTIDDHGSQGVSRHVTHDRTITAFSKIVTQTGGRDGTARRRAPASSLSQNGTPMIEEGAVTPGLGGSA
jgi:hypothetical protein